MYHIGVKPVVKGIGQLFGEEGDLIYDEEFQLLLLANSMVLLGTTMVSPLLETLTVPFGVSSANIGLLVSVFIAPSIVLIPISGVLADRYGRKPVISTGLLVFGTAGAGIAFTGDFRVALALRFVQGIGFSGVQPVVIASLGDFYQGAKETTAQGLRIAVIGIALVVFPLTAGVLVTVAWQYPFLLYGLTLPIALIFVWKFVEPARETTTITDGSSYIMELLDVASQRHITGIILTRITPGALWVGFLTYNSGIVAILGGEPWLAGGLVAISTVVNAVTGSQAGRIASGLGGRLQPLLFALFSTGGGLVTVAVAPSVLFVAIGVMILGFGFGLGLALTRSLLTGAAPSEFRGGVVSLGESVGRLAATVMPLLMGGVIALISPRYGFEFAVRVASGSAGILGILIGVLGVFLVRQSHEFEAKDIID